MRRPQSIFLPYVLAVLISFAALWARQLLAPYLGASNPFHTAWLGVIIAAWWLGLGPSILTLVIESLGVWYFFLPFTRTFHFQDTSVAGGLIGFVLLSALIVALSEMNRRSRRSLTQQARLLDLSYDAIFVHDLTNRIVYWSRGAAETYGYSSEEAIGRIAYELLQTKFPESLQAVMSKLEHDEQWSGELVHICKDGSQITDSSRWALFRDEKGSASILEINRDITALKRAETELHKYRDELEQRVQARTSELAEANQQLRALSVTLLRAQDEERRRIARELHDSAGQYLAAVLMALETVGKYVKLSDGSLARQVEQATKATQSCISEVRTISHLLHPPLLDELGLGSAVSNYLEGFAARSGIRVQVEMPEDLPRLGSHVEILLFRVLQESLTNVHRHSGSKTAFVTIGADSEKAWVEIRDHGKGASLRSDSSEPFRAGVGITGIRERARDLGGSAEISADENGTRVRVIVPLSHRSGKAGEARRWSSETG